MIIAKKYVYTLQGLAIMSKPTPVPVLMFHSIKPRAFINSPLSVPLDIFKDNMKALAEKGYITISLKELYNYVNGNTVLAKKAVCLTFDDGFLDNWIYAYPILKEFGLQATIFPVIDFIGDGSARKVCMPSSSNSIAEKDSQGSVRWSELLEMEASGVFDVQSHTVTHARLFKGPEILRYLKPEENLPWLAWNLYPEKKKRLLESACKNMIPLGYPIFEFDRALGVREFIPNERLIHLLLRHITNNGDAEFFLLPDWRNRLESVVNQFVANGNPNGKYETEEQNNSRIIWELKHSKTILESKLDKEIEFLCWPGGGRTPDALKKAKEVGYLATTCPSAESSSLKNVPGEDPFQIRRIGSCSRLLFNNSLSTWAKPRDFISAIDSFREVLLAEAKRKIFKLAALAKMKAKK